MRFNHVGISVTDIERSIAFYRDMLGLEQLCEVFPFGGEDYERIMELPGVTGRMCMVGNGHLQLELFEFAGGRAKDPNHPVSDRGYSHFGVEVDDIAATFAKLTTAGTRTHGPVITFNGGSMHAAYCRDPDGNVFELVQPGRRAEAGAS